MNDEKESTKNWDLLSELDAIQNELRSLFSKGVDLGGRGDGEGETPVLSLSEDNKSYRLTFELDRFKKKDLEVSFDEGLLTLRGERAADKKKKNGAYIRRFALPDDAQIERIEACFREGILSLVIPKVARKESELPQGRWEVKIES